MGMSEGENQISLLHFPQRFVEVVARLVFLTLWTPDIALPDLMFEGLFMVHPPEAHGDQ
jgi:hypothetical protein